MGTVTARSTSTGDRPPHLVSVRVGLGDRPYVHFVAYAERAEIALEHGELDPQVIEVGHLERGSVGVDRLTGGEMSAHHVSGDGRAHHVHAEGPSAAERRHALLRGSERGLSRDEVERGELGLSRGGQVPLEQIRLATRVDLGGLEPGFRLKHTRLGLPELGTFDLGERLVGLHFVALDLERASHGAAHACAHHGDVTRVERNRPGEANRRLKRRFLHHRRAHSGTLAEGLREDHAVALHVGHVARLALRGLISFAREPQHEERREAWGRSRAGKHGAEPSLLRRHIESRERRNYGSVRFRCEVPERDRLIA